METIFFERTGELKREIKALEEKLGVALSLKGKQLVIEGDPYKEYEAIHILEAMQFGFSAKKSLQLLDEDLIFRKLNIKEFTRRKDMKEVRSRIIGKKGKTKRTIEEISSCDILIKNDNTLGIIGPSEAIDEATTAITNLIRGSKQANIYHFLERMNAVRKDQTTDLGLKIKTQKT
jgi:ribosomal RNA assembly protein